MTKKPLFLSKQWHLRELNVKYAWEKKITGKNITVCVVDDGVFYNPDLEIEETKVNPIINNLDILLRKESYLHGTSVAGIIGAKGNEYVLGIAYDCKLIAYNIGDSNITAKYSFADFILNNNNKIDIFNNSWGPPLIYGPNIINPIYVDIIKSMNISSKEGRNKKGNIFVFASGNENLKGGSSTYNKYCNQNFIIAVGAANSNLNMSTYSSYGLNVLCMAPAGFDVHSFKTNNGANYMISSEQLGITTTMPYTKYLGEKGFIPYTHDFYGTSAACPMVSGCVALLLSYRPDLTWRDVKELISRSCYQDYDNNVTVPNEEFILNGRKQIVSQRTGYGLINVDNLIKNAKKWKLLPKEKNIREEQYFDIVLNGIDNTKFTVNFEIDKKITIETVQVYLTANSKPSLINELIFNTNVTIISPQGTKLPLIDIPYTEDDTIVIEYQYYDNEPFLCELLRGEKSNGIWTIEFNYLSIEDSPSSIFNLKYVKLDIFGH